jgi:hypothetical protein
MFFKYLSLFGTNCEKYDKNVEFENCIAKNWLKTPKSIFTQNILDSARTVHGC